MTRKGKRHMGADSEDTSDEDFFPGELGKGKGKKIGIGGGNLAVSNIESDFGDTRICIRDESGARMFGFNRKNLFDEPKLELGMYFAYKSDFATVVRSVAVKQKRSVKLTKNDARRVYAKCKDASCGWGVHLVKVKNEEAWKVNEYYHKHTCKPSYNCSSVKTGWLAEKYIESLKTDPNKGVEAFRKEMVKELGCHVSRTQAHEVKKKALKMLTENHLDHLALPWDDNKETRTDSGTMVTMGSVECNVSKVKKRGRPTKKRKLELLESSTGRLNVKEQYRTKRQQKTVTCKICSQQGHNKARCPNREQGGDKGKAPMIEEEVNHSGALVVYSQTVEEVEPLLISDKDAGEKSDEGAEGASQVVEDVVDKDQSGGSTANDVELKKESVPAQSESDRLRLILSVVDQMKEADSLIKVKSLVALTSRTLQKFIEKENNKGCQGDRNNEAVDIKYTIEPRVGQHATIRGGKADCNNANKLEPEANAKKSKMVFSTVEQKEKKTKMRKVVDDDEKRSGVDMVGEPVTIHGGKAGCSANNLEPEVDIQMASAKKSTMVFSTVEQREKRTRMRKVVDDDEKRSGVYLVGEHVTIRGGKADCNNANKLEPEVDVQMANAKISKMVLSIVEQKEKKTKMRKVDYDDKRSGVDLVGEHVAIRGDKDDCENANKLEPEVDIQMENVKKSKMVFSTVEQKEKRTKTRKVVDDDEKRSVDVVADPVTVRGGKADFNNANKLEAEVDFQMGNAKLSKMAFSTVEQKEKRTKMRNVVDDNEKRSGVDMVIGLGTPSGLGNASSAKQQPSRFKVLEIANNFNKTPLTIPFSFDIFGLKHNEQLDTKVVYEFFRERPCTPSAMAIYIRYLYESAIIPFNLRRKFAFLSPKEMYIPCTIGKTLLNERITLASEYVAGVMCTMLEKDGLLLAPLEVGDHWILVAVNPGKMKVYLCDSNECFHSEHHIQLTIMYRALAIIHGDDESSESLYKKYKPVNVNVPRHEKGDQSGMCVMRYIKEIVYHRVTLIPPEFYSDSRCFRYNKGMLDAIKEEWSSYIIELTRKNDLC